MRTQLPLCDYRRCLILAAFVLLFAQGSLAGPRYRVLHSFDGTDGSSLWRGVVLDGQGDVFGTAVGGGGSGCYGYGCGTVFELLPRRTGKWRFALVHNFGDGLDGAVPYGGLVLDASGNLYGTTTMGGANNSGTAFELSPDADGWSLTTLYDFCSESGCPDVGTMAALAWGKKGELYGTSQGGGTDGGEIFELAPSHDNWSYTLIHTFQASHYNQPAPGGSNPYAGLIVDSAGNLYGTTWIGGIACAGGNSCGVVYELTPKIGGGWKEIVLHRFHGTDGVNPGWGALLLDASGALYGTTTGGGLRYGVVYKLTPQPDGHWKEKILYEFKGGAKGFLPNAGVVMDKAGNLYGITDAGGYGDCGVIYKLAPQPTGKWAYTVLHTFGQGDDGCMPEGNLAINQKGKLYGGTVLGGAYGAGIVFQVTP